MAINHLVGIGAGLVGLSARKDGAGAAAKELAEVMLFGGSYETVIGNDARNCIGGRRTHIYGDDTKLLFGRSLLGPFVGLFLDAFSKGAMISGIQGDVAYNYGQKVDLVYGGPITRITRGPTIQKTNFRQLTAMSGKFGLLDLVKGSRTALSANRPKPPAMDVIPTINLRAFNPEIDAAYEKPILACSILLTAMSAAVDLTIRFKYPDYQVDFQKPDRNVAPVPQALRLVTGILSRLLMGLIYHMELLSIHDNDEVNAQSGASSSLAKATSLTATGATDATAQIKNYLKRATRFLAVLIYNVIVLALVAAVVAVIVAVVAVVSTVI
jgi:hypothetical protein